MIWEPEYSIWEPEFSIWEPKYFIWEPEYLIWEPKYLIWKPEYLVKSCPQGACAGGFRCGENFPDKKVRPFHLSIISLCKPKTLSSLLPIMILCTICLTIDNFFSTNMTKSWSQKTEKPRHILFSINALHQMKSDPIQMELDQVFLRTKSWKQLFPISDYWKYCTTSTKHTLSHFDIISTQTWEKHFSCKVSTENAKI